MAERAPADDIIGRDKHLSTLHDLLRGRSRPLPAVAISLDAMPDAETPAIHIGYGTTVPRMGMVPKRYVIGDQGSHVHYGVGLPVNGETQGSVAFIPSKGTETVPLPPDGDIVFTSWDIAGLGHPWPHIIIGREEAAREAVNAVKTARDLPGHYRETYDRAGGHLRQHVIALGGPAVLSALDSLEMNAAGDAAAPEPLVGTLDMVAAGLALSR